MRLQFNKISVFLVAIILMINSNVHAETYHIDGYVILEDLLLPVELQIIEIRDQNGSFITSLITNMDGFYTGEFEIDPAFSPYVSVELWRFCNGEIIFYNHDIMLNNPCLTSTFFVCRNLPCIANFNYTQTALNSLEIEFTDISQGDITSWFWDFGDGEFSTEQNPTHIYELEDHYQVKLTAMGTNCVDEKHRGLFVFYQDCLAKFTYEQTNEGDDLIVRFFDGSQGDIDQWFWDFDDGGSSGQQNPEHQFAEPGNYLVNLHINGPGCWNSTWQTVIVMPVPGCFPHFNYEQLHGANLELVFSDLSVADSISTWNWEFGDGNMSNLANPNHIYDSAGYYDVSLEINGPCCNCFFTRNIQVLTSNDCTADFDYQQPSLYEPIVEFQNLSTGEHLEYFWDFGDGTTATETSPVHEFPAFGSYDVTLKNTGFGCTDTIIKDVQVIEMIPCEAIFSFWSASPESTEIHFINESVGLIEEYLWKFGDGTFSNEENPIHNYAQHGDYTVELNIFSSNCADSTNLLVQIAEPAFCDAIFSFWSESPESTEIHFTDESVGLIEEYLWDFGDGSFSTEVDPIHNYSQHGDYTVELKIFAGSCEDSTNLLVEIAEPVFCEAAFSIVQDFPQSRVISFLNESSGNDFSSFWDFGDGATANEPSPEHEYSNPGQYLVSLAISTSNDCQDTAWSTIEILAPLTITGTVIAGTNTLLLGEVVLYKYNNPGGIIIDNRMSLDEGYFNFTDLQPGSYFVYAIPDFDFPYPVIPNYFPTYSGQRSHWLNAQAYNTDNLPGSITITLSYFDDFFNGKATADGRIESSSDNSGIPFVMFLYNETGNLRDFRIIDQQNTFNFSGIPFGKYELYPEKAGKIGQSYFISLSKENPEIYNIVFSETDNSIVPDLTAINDLNIPKIVISPNPASEYFIINIDENAFYNSENQIKLYNSELKLICEYSFNGNHFKMDVSGYQQGIFFMQLTNKTIQIRKKIIIMH